MTRLTRLPRLFWLLLLGTLLLVLLAVPLTAQAGAYQPTLTASPSTVHVGETVTVAGCGYDPLYGNPVYVTFGGVYSAGTLDSAGCFGGVTFSATTAGTVEVDAIQRFHGHTWSTVASTTVTVLP